MEIVVGISGASGVQYGIRLLQVLREKGCITHLVITDSAAKIIEIETDYLLKDVQDLADHVYASCDFAAPIRQRLASLPCHGRHPLQHGNALGNCLRLLGHTHHPCCGRLPQREKEADNSSQRNSLRLGATTQHGRCCRGGGGCPAGLPCLLLPAPEPG